MIKSILIVSVLVVLLEGCVVNQTLEEDNKNSSLTHGQVQMTLKKGVTTKSEIIETFGAPNITTIDSNNREVWTYQKHATVAQSSSSSSYGTIILFGGSQKASGFSQSSSTITLIIKFDESDKVYDFKSRSSSF